MTTFRKAAIFFEYKVNIITSKFSSYYSVLFSGSSLIHLFSSLFCSFSPVISLVIFSCPLLWSFSCDLLLWSSFMVFFLWSSSPVLFSGPLLWSFFLILLSGPLFLLFYLVIFSGPLLQPSSPVIFSCPLLWSFSCGLLFWSSSLALFSGPLPWSSFLVLFTCPPLLSSSLVVIFSHFFYPLLLSLSLVLLYWGLVLQVNRLGNLKNKFSAIRLWDGDWIN